MSDPDDRNKILIKFEIHVPVGAGQAPVILNAPPSPPATPGPAAPPAVVEPPKAPAAVHQVTQSGRIPAMVGIIQPGATAQVKAGTNTTEGVICVTAHETPDLWDRLPVDVYCKIVSPSEPIPPDPTASGVNATRATQAEEGKWDNWKIDELGTAPCRWEGSGTGLPFSELVVWRRYPNETFWNLEVRSFRGKCTLLTFCEENALHVFDTVPAVVELLANGFGNALGPLNGRWQLPRVEQTAPGKTAWSSGGDGVVSPRIQLHGPSCDGRTMSLELACGGKRLTYKLAATDFRPLGENRFRWCNQESPPRECSFPAELTVTPARGDA